MIYSISRPYSRSTINVLKSVKPVNPYLIIFYTVIVLVLLQSVATDAKQQLRSNIYLRNPTFDDLKTYSNINQPSKPHAIREPTSINTYSTATKEKYGPNNKHIYQGIDHKSPYRNIKEIVKTMKNFNVRIIYNRNVLSGL